MPQEAPARFVRALAEGILRDTPPADAAAAAHEALQPLWQVQRTLVLDVQFTGFSARGQLVGGVDPTLLRAAGALIMQRVNRIGFTPEAGRDDVLALLDALLRSGEEAQEGMVAALRERAPRGIYVATTAGEAYRPAREAAPAVAEVGGTPEASAAPPTVLSRAEEADLSAFELIEDVEVLTRRIDTPPAAPQAAQQGGGSRSDMFAYFRTAEGARREVKFSDLPGLLHGARDIGDFEQIASECTHAAVRLLRATQQEDATLLLDALVREAERPERTRFFREAAVQALRRAVNAETLPQLLDLVQRPGDERDRALHVLATAGGEGLGMLENLLFRTGDAEFRQNIFQRLLPTDAARKAVVRSLTEPPARLRQLLELVTLPQLDAEFAQRWLTDAAQSQDPGVRADVARHASAVGGRAGLRVLLDLLNDPDKNVIRAALIGLATLGDPAAVPFLARLLNENADEVLQLGAIAALGRTGSPDALPPLLAMVNRRQLITTRRMQRLKSAAVEAIGRTGASTARDILQGIAHGSDAELAAEARRALSLLD